MSRRPGRLLLAICAAALTCACSPPRDPIHIEGSTLTVENQSSSDWSNVRITVNDHFRGGAPKLAAGGRLTAPLTQFQTAYGQRFALDRQTVFKVEVTATDAVGEPVALMWGNSRK